MTLSRSGSYLDYSTGSTYRKKIRSNLDNYMFFCLGSVLCNVLGQFLSKIEVEDMKVNGMKSNSSLLNNMFFWRKKSKKKVTVEFSKAFAIVFKLPFKSARAMHSRATMQQAVVWPRLYWRRKHIFKRFLHREVLKVMPMDCTYTITSSEAFTKKKKLY